MKPSLRKHIATALAALMLAGAMTGCGNTPASESGTSSQAGSQSTASDQVSSGAEDASLDEVTLKIYFAGDTPAHVEEVWQNVEELSKDELNAKFDVTFVPGGDYADKMQLQFASGDDFGIYFDANWIALPTMLKNGVLMDVDSLMDQYAPNLKAYLEDEGVLEWAYVDGKLMCVPFDNPSTSRAYVTYREDLREKYDLPEKMETIEDIENYLEVVTANEDILPINNIIGSVMWDNAMNAMSTKYSLDSQFGSSNFDITYVLTDETVTVVPLEQTDAFMEASQIRRRWYEKGWIPSNAMNDTETVNGIDEGKYACTIRWTEDAYKPLTGPGEKGACMLYPDSVCAQNNSLSNVIGFNKNAANPERAMMFLEWMNASQENYDSVLYGIEGTTYVLEEDENGNQSVMYPEGENAQNGYLDWSGRWAFWRDQWRRPGFELSQELIEKNREDLDYENNIKSPMAGFTFDTDPVKEELANRQAVMDEYGKMLQYGLQEDVEAAVADYIDRMEVAGTDKIVEELQRQVDEFLAAKE